MSTRGQEGSGPGSPGRDRSATASPDEGSSLDIWLAEHLFGWRRVVEPYCQWRYSDRGRDLPAIDADIPAYSSTYGGMGLVLEQMRERGFMYRLTGVATISARFTKGLRPFDVTGFAEADALPMAVALAARAALEAESSR